MAKKKKKDVKLNRALKISFIVCLISGIIALMLVLGKGKILGKNILKLSLNEEAHTIEIVAEKLYLTEDESTQLKVMIDGVEELGGYELTIEKPDVISLEDRTITALKKGSSIIKAKSTEYNVESQIKVDVVIPVTKITLTAELYNVAVGDTISTFYQLRPTDGVAVFTYQSSDDSIATVDNEGKVKAISAGAVTITATDEITGKSASCKLNIK